MSNHVKTGPLHTSSVRWFGILFRQTLAHLFNGRYRRCPFYYGGGPGKARAEGHHAQVRAGEDTPLVNRLAERYRNRGGGGVAVLLDVDENLLAWQI